MSAQLYVQSMGATQIAVGLSAITAIVPAAYQVATTIKIVSGSGTLWITPLTPLALSGTSAAASIAKGYPLASTEIFNVGGPASFYLSAAAATMTVALLQGYSGGQSLI